MLHRFAEAFGARRKYTETITAGAHADATVIVREHRGPVLPHA